VAGVTYAYGFQKLRPCATKLFGLSASIIDLHNAWGTVWSDLAIRVFNGSVDVLA